MTQIQRALEYLRQSQLPWGEFPTYASPDPEMATGCRLDSSPFVTSLVAHSLGQVDHALARGMVASAVDFLRSEMEGPGLWRYWSSQNPRHRELELDLDDTCCAAHALRQSGREVPDNAPVLLANRSPEGLFYTYVAPRTGSPPQVIETLSPLADGLTIVKLAMAGMLHEIDPVVQANVLLWLGETEETWPVVDYLAEVVRSGSFASRYYTDPLAFTYFVARAYAAGLESLGVLGEEIVAWIERREAEGCASALATALAACTLRNFGGKPDVLRDAVASLLTMQSDDGSWPRSAFYTDRIDFYGSAALTTAFCVEALVDSRSGTPS